MAALYEFIKKAVIKGNSSLCIGLDPEDSKLPKKFAKSPTPYFDFNREIIDATWDTVCGYKPQFAHYAAFGKENELELTIKYIKDKSKDLLVILDSKRGDIGNTAKYYAKESFERYGAHIVTINPYMGFDSVNPFLNNSDNGAFILCRTSNQSGSDFQNLVSLASQLPLYLEVAKRVSHHWNNKLNCGLVLGATFPTELAAVRDLVGADIPFLVPGVGTQGGSVSEVIEAGYTHAGSIIINSSRGIIYKDSSDNYAITARNEAEKLRDQINLAITDKIKGK